MSSLLSFLNSRVSARLTNERTGTGAQTSYIEGMGMEDLMEHGARSQVKWHAKLQQNTYKARK